MPTAQALRLCPHAVCVMVPGERIRQKSREVFSILERYSPLVQPLSVDEAFLDMTGTARALGPPEEVARKLKLEISKETGLTASVGVAFNKFLAKLASDLDKPDGLVVVTPDNLDATLLPLPVSKVWGIGPATQRRLERHRIRTVADLRRLSAERLTRLFGENGERFYRLCRGIDHRPVVPDRTAKSIGHEQTFAANLTDPDHVRSVLLDQAEQVGRRLRAHGYTARGVTVKIRFGDFQTLTRSHTLHTPTDLDVELYAAGRALFDRWAATSFSPVRLIGLSASPVLRGAGQQPLFAQADRHKQQRLDAALDRITERFGKRTVHRGSDPRP